MEEKGSLYTENRGGEIGKLKKNNNGNHVGFGEKITMQASSHARTSQIKVLRNYRFSVKLKNDFFGQTMKQSIFSF